HGVRRQAADRELDQVAGRPQPRRHRRARGDLLPADAEARLRRGLGQHRQPRPRCRGLSDRPPAGRPCRPADCHVEQLRLRRDQRLLAVLALRSLEGKMPDAASGEATHTASKAGDLPVVAKLMQGKRGLIMGVANDRSIAWGIAQTLAGHGAKLAFTYQGEALGKRVKPLAASVEAELVLPCDVEDPATVDAVFGEIGRMWGTLDFLVHAIAFSDKTQLAGRYADTTRE